VFEAAWKSTPAPDRELWRGLAQIAVGLTHARRGNARGAAALLRRGARQVREHAPQRGTDKGAAGQAGLDEVGPDEVGPEEAGVDAAYVAAQAEEIAARIESGGLAAVPEADLRLALREA
jgi:hypothetical protein